MSEDKKPTLVAANDAKQIERRRREDELGVATVRLAANLLRVMAGTGERQELAAQVARLAEQLTALRASGDPNGNEIMAATLHDRNWRKRRPGYSTYDPYHPELLALRQLTEAALRYVAAELLEPDAGKQSPERPMAKHERTTANPAITVPPRVAISGNRPNAWVERCEEKTQGPHGPGPET